MESESLSRPLARVRHALVADALLVVFHVYWKPARLSSDGLKPSSLQCVGRAGAWPWRTAVKRCWSCFVGIAVCSVRT